MEMNKLQGVLKAFDYLPMGYNDRAFQILFNKLLQRAESEVIHLNILPYRRLNHAQVTSLFKACANHVLKIQ